MTRIDTAFVFGGFEALKGMGFRRSCDVDKRLIECNDYNVNLSVESNEDSLNLGLQLTPIIGCETSSNIQPSPSIFSLQAHSLVPFS